jgi:hypothetical protein
VSILQSQSGRPPDIAMSGIGIGDEQVSAQLPLQQICVPVQVWVPQRQMPPTQVDPVPHEWPQAPQLRMSLVRSAQPALGQQVWPIEQGAPEGRQPQWPPTHTVPLVHAALQPPQLCTSIMVSTQLAPQQVPEQLSGWAGQMPPPLVPPRSCLPPPTLFPDEQACAINTDAIIKNESDNNQRIYLLPKPPGTYLALSSL